MKFRFLIATVLLALLLATNRRFALNGSQRTIEMLVRGGPESQRDAAQNIYNGVERNPEVLDIVAEVLLQGYQRPGNIQVDATSWMCKALGASGKARYRGVLQQIADKAAERKVRKYAEQSLALLPQSDAAPYIAGTVDLEKLREAAASTREAPQTGGRRRQGPTPTAGGAAPSSDSPKA